MDPATHLTHLEADVARVLATSEDHFANTVPNCPEWTIFDLLEHCAGVFNYASVHIESGPAGRLADNAELAGGDTGMALFEREATRLIGLLQDLDPTEPRPNWALAPTSAWYFRRMAQELAVHRWDIDHAAGTPRPIDADLAVDGVDEFFEVFVIPWAEHRNALGTGETVHLHATDEDLDGGEWMITFGTEAITVDHEHGKGDMAGRATASDLLLFAWNRRPIDITCFGDTDLLTFWPTKLAA